jgi:hypothetical protein
MTNKQEDTLIKVWNRLEEMWLHHQDGSDFCPITKVYLNDKWNSKLAARRKSFGNDAIFFDILFNEIQHTIKDAVSKERHKELK